MNIIQYESYQEKRISDKSDFPYLTYPCSIPLDFLKVPLHWHDEMEFIYIKKGTGTVSVDFTAHTVAAGDIVIISPGQLHAIDQHENYSMEYENIIFPLTLLYSRHPDICWEKYIMPINSRKFCLPDIITPADRYYTAVSSCLDEIDNIRQNFPEAYELLIKGKLFELFFHLYEYNLPKRAARGNGSSRSNSAAHNQKTLDKTKQILKYVEQNYSRKITIKEMAEACSFSQSHFMKFFKSTIGTSFTVYLNDYRLIMASRLLISSDDSVLTISAECGFDNLSYFNRTFRQKFSMTPSEFRYHGQHII